ncbi:MAG: J domain-containing protein [Mycoplasmataceae bacterium]|nr:J domain-containing protein [Mycoplasmataceae bacterium]
MKFSFGGEDDDSPFGDIFGSLFGNQRNKRASAKQQIPKDIELNLQISFLDSVRGAIKNVKYEYLEVCPHCHGSGAESPSDIKTCPHCNGSGRVTVQQKTPFGTFQQSGICSHCGGSGKVIMHKCHVCNGSGTVKKVQTLEVNIPGGISNTTKVINGYGNTVGKNRGTLYIHITVLSNPLFTRNGDKIYAKVLVDPLVAIAGGVITIPTPYGVKDVLIKQGTANGDEITIAGSGINFSEKKMFGGNKRGDLIIVIQYAKPNTYNNDELARINLLSKKPNEVVNDYLRKIEKELGRESKK